MKSHSEIKVPLYYQAYLDKGVGSPVVLLHGLFGNLNLWMPTVQALEKKYRVIVPRLPIYDLPLHQTNIKYLVRSLRNFIEWHQLTDVTLVGHAVGGQLALLYANLYPAEVTKIVLVASDGLINPKTGNLSDVDWDFDSVSEQVKNAFHEEVPEIASTTKEIYEVVQNAPKRLSIASLLQSARHTSVSSFLTRLDHPVQLIWGLQDKISPPDVALHFHDLLANGEVNFIDQCGHVPMVEQPEKFNELLLKFIDQKSF